MLERYVPELESVEIVHVDRIRRFGIFRNCEDISEVLK